MMCLETRDIVLEMKERSLPQNQEMDDENEEVSEEEGSTPNESARMSEDESIEEDNAEESNSDMLLRTYLNNNKKKV